MKTLRKTDVLKRNQVSFALVKPVFLKVSYFILQFVFRWLTSRLNEIFWPKPTTNGLSNSITRFRYDQSGFSIKDSVVLT